MLKFNWLLAMGLGSLTLMATTVASTAQACPQAEETSTLESTRPSAPSSDADIIVADQSVPSYATELLRLTNQERQRQGLAPLRLSPNLTQAAQRHAEDMVRSGNFSHTGSDGSQPSDRAIAAGYQFRYVGENIAAGHRSPASTIRQWMQSSGHRANILKPEYTEVGFGYVSDSSTPYRYYWVQVFGSSQ